MDFTPQKETFFSWGSDVRIEMQMSELSCRDEIVMKSLASYICNDQMSELRCKCRNWGANVRIEAQRGTCNEIIGFIYMQWSNVRIEIANQLQAEVVAVLWPEYFDPVCQLRVAKLQMARKHRPRQRTKAVLHHHNWPNHLPCKHWIVNKPKWCKHGWCDLV